MKPPARGPRRSDRRTSRRRFDPGQSGPRDVTDLFVHVDDDLVVVNKPPGLLTSSGTKDRRPTLWNLLKQWQATQPRRGIIGLIHRLDREVGGLLVFSRRPAAYHFLKSQLARRTMRREYLAVVHGMPSRPGGEIRKPLREGVDGVVRVTHGGMPARTHYQLVSAADDRACLRVRLETGRKHQIRAHLASIGHPVVGDTVYGDALPSDGPSERIMLFAATLAFVHPRTGEPMLFELPPPSGFTSA